MLHPQVKLGECHKLNWHLDLRTLTARISERKQSWQRLMGGRGFLSLPWPLAGAGLDMGHTLRLGTLRTC